MSRFTELFGGDKPLIGMIHLAALPDYAQSPGLHRVIDLALRDLRTLEQAGFAGVLVENEYDRPHRIAALPETIAAMTQVTKAVVSESRSAVVGCEVLLNDPRASLDIARQSGARFIRTDYFVDEMTRSGYGEFSIDPTGLIDYRSSSGGGDIAILADIQVKYASMVKPRPLRDSAQIACEKLADAVIVSGDASGNAPTAEQLREAAEGVRASGHNVPVLIGSGLDAKNAKTLFEESGGAIVGTSLMKDRAVNPDAARELVSMLSGV